MELYIAFFAMPFFSVAILTVLFVVLYSLAGMMRLVVDWVRVSWL
jgi:hypothetical protein